MTLQSSGPVCLGDIRDEFGGSGEISLSDYFSAATGVPASGSIGFGHFPGK